jgi:hypothetical protein
MGGVSKTGNLDAFRILPAEKRDQVRFQMSGGVLNGENDGDEGLAGYRDPNRHISRLLATMKWWVMQGSNLRPAD